MSENKCDSVCTIMVKFSYVRDCLLIGSLQKIICTVWKASTTYVEYLCVFAALRHLQEKGNVTEDVKMNLSEVDGVIGYNKFPPD